MNITRSQLKAQYDRAVKLGWLPFFQEAADTITKGYFDEFDLTRNMLPRFAVLNPVNSGRFHIELFGQSKRHFPLFQSLNNLLHLFTYQTSSIDSFTARHSFRTYILSVSQTCRASALYVHIAAIVGGGAEKQMVRSNTKRIVAFMTNQQFLRIGNRNAIGNTGSAEFVSTHIEVSVPICVSFAKPRPARIRFLHSAKETYKFCFGQNRNANILSSHGGFTSLVKLFWLGLSDCTHSLTARFILPQLSEVFA